MKIFNIILIPLVAILFAGELRAAPTYEAQSLGQRKNSRARVLAKNIFDEYGILVKNSSDKHSTHVLENLLFLLRNTLSASFIREIKTFHYFNASAEENPKDEIASFHLNDHAIAIAGISAYPDSIPIDPKTRMQILSALAHELGHAVLFAKISPLELKNISEKYGSWNSVFLADGRINSLFDAAFFMPYPLPASRWKENSVATGYSTENIHEWFADAFAAFLLEKLGKKGLLGRNWQESLISIPKGSREYWTNYNNLSPDFSAWLEHKTTQTRSIAESD